MTGCWDSEMEGRRFKLCWYGDGVGVLVKEVLCEKVVEV